MKFLYSLSLLFICFSSQAADSLQVSFDKQRYMPGDTLTFHAQLMGVDTGTKSFHSLHLWLEDVQHVYQWKLRYPLIGGSVSARIVLPKTMATGYYSANFSVQHQFLSLSGFVQNKKTPPQLNYILLTEDQDYTPRTVAVDETGFFQIPYILMFGKGNFFFSKPEKKGPPLDMTITTTVDSSFTPMAACNHIFALGDSMNNSGVKDYVFDKDGFDGNKKGELQNVVITGKKISESEKFDASYATGLFSADGRLYGNFNDEMTPFANVLDYLVGRSAGLMVSFNGSEYVVKWRGESVSFYLDEVPTSIDWIQNIPTADIAMVKLFPPPFFGATSIQGGGAVAVYTRKGEYVRPNTFGPHNRFSIQGYTPLEYTLIKK